MGRAAARGGRQEPGGARLDGVGGQLPLVLVQLLPHVLRLLVVLLELPLLLLEVAGRPLEAHGLGSQLRILLLQHPQFLLAVGVARDRQFAPRAPQLAAPTTHPPSLPPTKPRSLSTPATPRAQGHDPPNSLLTFSLSYSSGRMNCRFAQYRTRTALSTRLAPSIIMVHLPCRGRDLRPGSRLVAGCCCEGR